MAKYISSLAFPLVILIILITGLVNKVRVYECFLEGAKSALPTIAGIVPPLVALMTAIAMLRASGGLDLIIRAASPLSSFIKIPPEILPFALLRPLSGSGALAALKNILTQYGADSPPGLIASVISGASETTFYTLSVYFAATRAKNLRHAMPAALFGDILSLLVGVFVARAFFGL